MLQTISPLHLLRAPSESSNFISPYTLFHMFT